MMEIIICCAVSTVRKQIITVGAKPCTVYSCLAFFSKTYELSFTFGLKFITVGSMEMVQNMLK